MMRRVTRATSRAEVEINNVNGNISDKSDTGNPPSDSLEGMDENLSEFASKPHDPANKDAQKSKNDTKTRTKKGLGSRRPLGDIALNVVDDDAAKWHKTTNKAERRSKNSNTDSEAIDSSLGSELEEGCREDGKAENEAEIGKQEEQSPSAEFMEPSVLEVVEEVDEDAGEGERVVGKKASAEKTVEGSGADSTSSKKMDSNIGSLDTKVSDSSSDDKAVAQKIEMNMSNEEKSFAAVDAESKSQADGNFSTVLQSSLLAKITSNSSPKPLKRPEDSIEDMDAMAAAIEELGEALPSLRLLESPVRSNTSSEEATSANQSKISKTPQGQPSIAKRTGSTTKNDNLNSVAGRNTGRPATKSNNVSAQHPNRLNRSRASTSGMADKNRSSSSAASKTVDYLASRRPSINLKFPTPPSAPKNVKPHVVPEFKLPSDALAAKFRAQREERLKKEQEEEAARRKFKARPVPRSLSTSVNSTMVGPRPTAVTKARENLMREAKADIPPNETVEQTHQIKRRSGFSGTDPSAASLEKRRSMIIASAQHEKRTVRRASSIMPLQSQTASRRNSIAASGNSAAGPTSKPAAKTIPDAAALRAKGKEVFNRGKLAKEEMERERQAKEEAARKARAEAAERGRQTSREWAEKQKQRMLAEKIKARVEAAKCA